MNKIYVKLVLLMVRMKRNVLIQKVVKEIKYKEHVKENVKNIKNIFLKKNKNGTNKKQNMKINM